MEHSVPAEWAAYGARFGSDGLLYLAEWRRGFTVHELRALFFECQQVRSLKARVRLAERDQARSDAEIDQLKRRCAFYRRNLVLESRLGLCLARLAA